MYSDNQAAIFFANNSTLHESTKHIEIDSNAIRHRDLLGLISIPYVSSSYHLADILSKRIEHGFIQLYFFQSGLVWSLCSSL